MSGWSDVEKIQLLFAIIEAHSPGPIKWKDVAIPDGRTVEACTHIVAKLKAEAYAVDGSPTKTSAQATPTKKNGKSPTKRKKGGNVHVNDDQAEDDGDGVGDVPSPTKRNRSEAAKYEIKYEDDADNKEDPVDHEAEV